MARQEQTRNNRGKDSASTDSRTQGERSETEDNPLETSSFSSRKKSESIFGFSDDFATDIAIATAVLF